MQNNLGNNAIPFPGGIKCRQWDVGFTKIYLIPDDCWLYVQTVEETISRDSDLLTTPLVLISRIVEVTQVTRQS
jgi:hypothetical protein